MSFQAADKHKTGELRPCQLILLGFDEHVLKNNIENVITTKSRFKNLPISVFRAKSSDQLRTSR